DRQPKVGDAALESAGGRFVDAKDTRIRALTAFSAGLGDHEVFAVARPNQRLRRGAFARERAYVFSRSCIPDSNLLFRAGRGDLLAVGAVGERVDEIAVARVGEDFMAVAEVPNFHGAI